MIHIEWTIPAFAILENLAQEIAYEIIRQVDLLATFPKIGAPLEARFPNLKGYRQLIIKQNFRIIYEFDEFEQTVFILVVQHCRQKLPSMRELKRRLADDEDSD